MIVQPDIPIRPIQGLLIANRGEIAVRITRTCREMGIRSIAVFSDADRDALHVHCADMAMHIGPAAVKESYLNAEAIINAAIQSGADAIHPGYGFLSENAGFARAVLEAGLIWVGPHPEAIEQMGSKAQAKRIMEEHGVPVIPGYNGDDQSDAVLIKEALCIGFPLLVKASAGGGGKGMVIVRDESGLAPALGQARREALAAFGDERLILERYFERVRHVEFQIFGDQHGNAVHLFERECSLQRRYQKILEESPSPVLTQDTRERMGQAALNAARALAYDNAGTVEFILLQDASFYFLEVNTRLQVEHPVTEMITGLDLVRLQIQSAEGRVLELDPRSLKQNGYAMELRLYAEDPASGFLPASGELLRWDMPRAEGIRIDSGVQQGSVIGTDYDPMMAKLIVWANDRPEAFRRMRYALENLVCLGPLNNQNFLLNLVKQEQVKQGEYHTHFLDEHPELSAEYHPNAEEQQALLMALSLRQVFVDRQSQQHFRSLPTSWRNIPGPASELRWSVAGKEMLLRYRLLSDETAAHPCLELLSEEDSQRPLKARWSGGDENKARIQMGASLASWVFAESQDGLIRVLQPGVGVVRVLRPERFPDPSKEQTGGDYLAPMPAEVSAVLVSEGQRVEPGAALLVLYSMKMEHTIVAVQEGIVRSLLVQTGERVEAGAALLELEHEISAS